MFNPAYPFTEELLNSFLTKEVYYFVKSTYARGINTSINQAYLISHYHIPSEAERHYNVIPNDKHRAIFDIRKTDDIERLKKETVPKENYQSFSKLMHPENEKRANAHFKEHTKRYLQKNTNWNLEGKVTIYPKFHFQLGELYVRMYHDGDEITVKFADIENS